MELGNILPEPLILSGSLSILHEEGLKESDKSIVVDTIIFSIPSFLWSDCAYQAERGGGINIKATIMLSEQHKNHKINVAKYPNIKSKLSLEQQKMYRVDLYNGSWEIKVLKIA